MGTQMIYGIGEINDALKNKTELMSPYLGVPANSKGCGGIVDISIMIPESVTLFVAPLGCGRHISTHESQRTGRVFVLALEEADVVTGKHIELVEQAAYEIYEYCKQKPKIIMICGSCIDRLTATDFEISAENIKNRIPVDVQVIWMDPVIGRKIHPQVRCWEKIYSLMDKTHHYNSVHLIGRLFPPSTESELRYLLMEAGIKNIKHIGECKTLEEYKSLGGGLLNILGSSLGEKSAKMIQKKYDIPYVKYLPTLNSDKVYSMYRDLEKRLNIKINDKVYFEKIKEQEQNFKKKCKRHPVHAAIGEAYASHTNVFEIACDVVKLGIQVDWLYSDGKLTGKEEEIAWLAENQPNAKVVFLSHPRSREILLNPPHVDFAWGMSKKWFEHQSDNHFIDVEERPIDCDYASISWFIKRIEKEVWKNA